MTTTTFQILTSPCHHRGILFQSSEIYRGFTSICNYGPFGGKLNKALTLTNDPARRADIEKDLAEIPAVTPVCPYTAFLSSHLTSGILLTT